MGKYVHKCWLCPPVSEMSCDYLGKTPCSDPTDNAADGTCLDGCKPRCKTCLRKSDDPIDQCADNDEIEELKQCEPICNTKPWPVIPGSIEFECNDNDSNEPLCTNKCLPPCYTCTSDPPTDICEL